MKPEYAAFLDQLIEEKRAKCVNGGELTRLDLVYAECQFFTKRFVERFPHLRRVPGFYMGVEHWWCVDTDGMIVDPTAEQFPKGGDYKEFNPEADVVRIGRCMNCGDHIYGLVSDGPKCICSEECAKAMDSGYELPRKL